MKKSQKLSTLTCNILWHLDPNQPSAADILIQNAAAYIYKNIDAQVLQRVKDMTIQSASPEALKRLKVLCNMEEKSDLDTNPIK